MIDMRVMGTFALCLGEMDVPQLYLHGLKLSKPGVRLWPLVIFGGGHAHIRLGREALHKVLGLLVPGHSFAVSSGLWYASSSRSGEEETRFDTAAAAFSARALRRRLERRDRLEGVAGSVPRQNSSAETCYVLAPQEGLEFRIQENCIYI